MNEQENLYYLFGPFRIDLASRLLLRDEEPEQLTPKAFETLLALVERGGRLVGKHELMNRVWPDVIVEEANLANNISMLRKILGRDADGRQYIQTLPRRGYRFVASVSQVKNGRQEPVAGETWDANGNRESVVVRSIAVLPFKVLCADDWYDYLGLGLADGVITRLSNLRGVVVRPTSALFRYVDRSPDPVSAGQELGVEAVLEGVIRRIGERLRVTAQLVSARDGAPIWAAKFDVQADQRRADLFALEDEVAEQVTHALALQLTSEQREQMRKRYTENTAAYHAYLKGRHYWSRWAPQGFRKAIEQFRHAIEEDPLYALAYAGLADSYGLLLAHGLMPMKEAVPLIEAATMKALALDDQLAEAHLSLACLNCWVYWNYPEAEKEFKRCLELKPTLALAYQAYALYLTAMGRTAQALAEIRHAQSLDPLSLINHSTEAFVLYSAGQYEQAAAAALRTLELDARFHPAYERLGEAYAQIGRRDEATVAFQQAVALSERSLLPLAGLGATYAASGKKSEALRIADEVRGKARPEYALAWIYASLGDSDQALLWLDAACQERDCSVVYLMVDPRLSSLHTDRRWRLLRERLGLASIH